jgi:hypothetical protein
VTTATVIVALKTALGLLFFWIFVGSFWKDYCLDSFREDIFAIRDDLFLYAADGNIDFGDPAYRILRNRLNVTLRYAHEFTLIRFVLALVVLSKVPNAETVAWGKALASLPSGVQGSLIQYRSNFVLAFLKYVTLRSFFLYIVFELVEVLGFCKQLASRYVLPKVAVGVERLESEALAKDVRDRGGPLLGAA